MINLNKNNSGTILLLALLIIAAILASAAIFANLIISEIRQSRLIDQSIQAYYLAESGAERALFQARKRQAVQSCEIGVSCVEDNGYCDGQPNQAPCITLSQGTLSADVIGNWDVAVDNEMETSIVLAAGSSFQLDLFGPLSGCPLNIDDPVPGVEKIELISSVDPLTLYGQLTNLSWLACSSGLCSNQSSSGLPVNYRDFISITAEPDEPQASESIEALDGHDITGDCSYSFRISYPFKINSDQPTKITLKTYDSADQQLPILSRLIISSSAAYGKSFQNVIVHAPVRQPLSGLYDFVLFSEKIIEK